MLITKPSAALFSGSWNMAQWHQKSLWFILARWRSSYFFDFVSHVLVMVIECIWIIIYVGRRFLITYQFQNFIDLNFSVPCWGARHTFVFLAFLGFANVYAMRVNLSVAIVAMVNHTAVDHLHNSSNLSEYYYLGPTSNIQGKCK